MGPSCAQLPQAQYGYGLKAGGKFDLKRLDSLATSFARGIPYLTADDFAMVKDAWKDAWIDEIYEPTWGPSQVEIQGRLSHY